MFSERAKRGWETRLANLREKGLLDADDQPTPRLVRRNRRIALKVWRTRRELYGETGISAHA